MKLKKKMCLSTKRLNDRKKNLLELPLVWVKNTDKCPILEVNIIGINIVVHGQRMSSTIIAQNKL